MGGHIRRNLVAYVALLFAMTSGSLLAKQLITGADIASDTITGGNIQDGTIENQDVSPTAAISGSKIDAASLAGVVHGSGHMAVHHLTMNPGTSVDVTPTGFGGSVNVSCSGPDQSGSLFLSVSVNPSNGGSLTYWRDGSGPNGSVGSATGVCSGCVLNNLQFSAWDIFNDADDTVVELNGVLRFLNSQCDAFLFVKAP